MRRSSGVSLLIGLLLAGYSKTPWPVAGCYGFVDAAASRLLDCGYYGTHAEAKAALLAELSTTESPRGCEGIVDIAELGLWFDECIFRDASACVRGSLRAAEPVPRPADRAGSRSLTPRGLGTWIPLPSVACTEPRSPS